MDGMVQTPKGRWQSIHQPWTTKQIHPKCRAMTEAITLLASRQDHCFQSPYRASEGAMSGNSQRVVRVHKYSRGLAWPARHHGSWRAGSSADARCLKVSAVAFLSRITPKDPTCVQQSSTSNVSPPSQRIRYQTIILAPAVAID